jgi:hypothetical protein
MLLVVAVGLAANAMWQSVVLTKRITFVVAAWAED